MNIPARFAFAFTYKTRVCEYEVGHFQDGTEGSFKKVMLVSNLLIIMLVLHGGILCSAMHVLI
jgi:hypothetical protein